jgi:hypothetical protein
MAVDFHLRVLDNGRQEVEEAQLARAILRRIADDLRSTIRYEKIDTGSILSSGATNLGGASALLGGSGQSGESGGTPPGSNSSGNSGSSSESPSSEEESGETQSVAESGLINPVPGLYGNLYELQVDVSRLPRIDQYDRLLKTEDGRLTDLVSDVKSVAYYLAGDSAGTTGLVRREMDRAATQWAQNNGGLQSMAEYEQLLAPEVVALEFRYFDGVDWLEEWDSSIANNLPVAVEISLAVTNPAVKQSAASMVDLASMSAEEGYRVYRLLVHLPASKSLLEQEAEAAAAAAAEADAASSSSSGGSSSSNNSQGMP